ncbi:MAG: PD-(D/E)XK nuclease family protein [Truepera sp.]|nr:PD-(D/E)XK nuclease family protein [Truepera sp.]
MSYSTLLDLEACPRRWALSAAAYPSVWKERGYPRPPQRATLEGTVVHLSLQRITRALVERGCPSLSDESAVSTLRELGGYTEVVLGSLELALQPYEGNPRADPVLEGIHHRLSAQVPELRSRVQRLLARIRPAERRAGKWETTVSHPGVESRSQLLHGSYAEVEIRAIEMGWRGFADLLTLSSSRCEIRDFKTGVPKQEHESQVRTYALLWARDSDLNPEGRLADKLVLSYNKGDIEVPAPDEREIHRLEGELQRRTAEALANLQTDPPEARPSRQNCKYCPVRHLCEEYWYSHARQKASNESAKNGLGDVQIGLTGQHGPSSWDGVIESGPDLKVSGPILLRTTSLQFELKPGQRVRLLNVHIRAPEEEPFEERQPTIVATMGANSEAFLLL